MLLTVKEPKDLAALVKAAAQLPEWAFAEEKAAEGAEDIQASNGAGSTRVPAGDSCNVPAGDVDRASINADELITSRDGGTTAAGCAVSPAPTKRRHRSARRL